MLPLLFPIPGNESLATSINSILHWEIAAVEFSKFPDGETYLRCTTPLKGRDISLVCSFFPADACLMPLYLAAQLCREAGAQRVGLVAPYLAYMRQDKAFKPGEAVSARYFLGLLSQWLDFLLTVDPHLHRIHSLNAYLKIPFQVIGAAPALAQWVRHHVRNALLIGPDEESRQWVAEVAQNCESPYAVFKKKRLGDRHVVMQASDLEKYVGRQPVIVDDILSTGTTLQKAADILLNAGFKAPIALCIHGLFSAETMENLRREGIERIVTCNTVVNSGNTVDLSKEIAENLRNLLQEKVII